MSKKDIRTLPSGASRLPKHMRKKMKMMYFFKVITDIFWLLVGIIIVYAVIDSIITLVKSEYPIVGILSVLIIVILSLSIINIRR